MQMSHDCNQGLPGDAVKIELGPQTIEAIVQGVARYHGANVRHNNDDPLFDVRGLAEYLHVTPDWIYERTHLKQIPYIKLSKKCLLFRKSAIDKWLDSLSMPQATPYTRKLRAVR